MRAFDGSIHKWICDEKSRCLTAMSVIVLTLSGCASGPTPAQKKEMAMQRTRIERLEQNLVKKQSILNEMRDRNLALEKRMNVLEKARAEAEKKAQEERAAQPDGNGAADKPPRVMQMKMRNGNTVVVSAQATSEQRLYSKVLESYRKKNAPEMQKSLQMLLKTYPDSVFADNALYVAGLLAYESHEYKHADEFMERVLREYPSGNKAVSALYAKAMIAKQIPGSELEARETLRRVKSLYPGSPEAKLALTEERLAIRTIGLNKQEM